MAALVGTDDLTTGMRVEGGGYTPPAWASTPMQQLERAEQLWAAVELPGPPVRFEPATPTEVPLLVVPDSFMQLYARLPGGYRYSWRDLGLPTSSFARRNRSARTDNEPVWLGFDPMYGLGQPPASLWDGDKQLASIEVLSAMIMFPGWVNTWPDDAAPWMSGFSFGQGESLSVPRFWLSWNRQNLELRSSRAGARSHMWASPSVRIL